MSEKSESEDFEEDDAEEAVGDGDDAALDHLIRDVEKQRRKAPKGAEPTWRRLERVMEDKRTAELLSDFDDYDIESHDGSADSPRNSRKRKKLPPI